MVRLPPESYKAVIYDTQAIAAATANLELADENKYKDAYEPSPLDRNQGEAIKVLRFQEPADVAVGYWKPVPADTSGRPGYRGCTIVVSQETYEQVGAHPALIWPAASVFLDDFDKHWFSLPPEERKGLGPKLLRKDRSSRWTLPQSDLNVPDDPSGLVLQREGHYLPLAADNYPLWEAILRSLNDVRVASPAARRYLVVSGVKEPDVRMALANSLLWMLPPYLRKSISVLTSAPPNVAQILSNGQWQLVVVQTLGYGGPTGQQGTIIDVNRTAPKGPSDGFYLELVEQHDKEGPLLRSRFRRIWFQDYVKDLSVLQFAARLKQESAVGDSSDLPKEFETYLLRHCVLVQSTGAASHALPELPSTLSGLNSPVVQSL